MRAVVLSDCRIGNPDANVALLNRFLMHLKCDRLVLAGGFFDLRQSTADEIRHLNPGTLESIRRIKTAGTKIEYILGNEDETYADTPVLNGEKLQIVESAEILLPSGQKVLAAPNQAIQSKRLQLKILGVDGKTKCICAGGWAESSYVDIRGDSINILGVRP